MKDFVIVTSLFNLSDVREEVMEEVGKITWSGLEKL